MNRPLYARQLNVAGCLTCGLVCRDLSRCPRCRTRLHDRRSDSLVRSWALLLAGIIFYLPANVLPVMHTSLFGKGGESTIMAGVIDFWRAGSYGIALVIFVASVVIPCMKFLSLILLLVASQRRSAWAMPERARLYRLVEGIGYWSMLDVVVVAAVSALVQFQTLSTVEPRSGILFFGLVVILTMLSAMAYDPRLIWQGDDDE
ncbi:MULTISPECIES: paraquat-inducible protein A [Enterobacterales]|uniref:paraquat-inducible protein A n=1 Tax=Enterobacterales TaxID=91347 RepID=UPI000F7F5FAA|nr:MULTISPECIES: paraquat-inducible protein A [Enterobacterales]RSV87633.1 paraquat-inducible protein A [Klebsiella aerogenes]CAI1949391.1 Inner membrane protein yebS [Serratia ficaria]CAI1999367.1 Inner membrane protein yebS [Serratia ficaria]CAI2452820.1 Inner membrane protein yebS [Serratia ficaria]CAI2518150.1 Inner membrane protein yebS [Serratia ficaria]